MKRKFNDITAFIVAMIAMFMSASCDVKQISGDTPLGVEAESAQLKGSFKLLSWNIQDGMWCDQFNNYDEFVAYVNGFAPDIFCIQEAATHWDIDGKNFFLFLTEDGKPKACYRALIRYMSFSTDGNKLKQIKWYDE